MDDSFIITSIAWIITTHQLTLSESESSVDSETNVSIRWSDRTVGVGVTAPLTQPEIGAHGRRTRQQVAGDYSSRSQQANVAQVGDEYNWLHLRADDRETGWAGEGLDASPGEELYLSTEQELNMSPVEELYLSPEQELNMSPGYELYYIKYIHTISIQNCSDHICTHRDVCTQWQNLHSQSQHLQTWWLLHPQWQ